MCVAWYRGHVTEMSVSCDPAGWVRGSVQVVGVVFAVGVEMRPIHVACDPLVEECILGL